MKFSKFVQVSALALATAFASASVVKAGDFERPIVGGSGSYSDTRPYLGLSWSFGGGASRLPSFVVGAQSIRVNSSNRLRGIDLNARFNLSDGFERIALSGLVGRRDIYANIGGGYNFSRNEFVGTAALQTTFVRAGLDVGMNTGVLEPYVEINTLDRPRRVSGAGLSCPDGYDLVSASDFPPSFLNPDLIVDGQVCEGEDFFD